MPELIFTPRTETVTLSDSTATWLSLLRPLATETVTVGEATAQGANPIRLTVTESFDRLTDGMITYTTGALEAGLYDVTFGGGDAAVGRWALLRTGSPVRCWFYTPAGGSFVGQLRVNVAAGEALKIEGPNAGLLNVVRRWV